MTTLIREKTTGDYYTEDRTYQIQKGTFGWNVNEWDRRGWYRYCFSCETLKQVKESL